MAEHDGDDLLRYRSDDDVIATMNAWKDLPPSHLKLALQFWNDRVTADHELRMVQEKNRNRLDVMGLIAAFGVSAASVGSAIYFGAIHDYWMAGIMLGPSVFAIMKLFITRKAGKTDLKAAGSTLGVISQPGGPPPLQ
ncbi:hypothetical protein OOK29_42975 [Streptomyces phaeochromogenes]|uniref:hypothetical protein n=1 Tax=Streptomyces TaxID=1883 RepID=UPI00224E025F|nr:hypothetical protein [Streptomyces phaeochromogenes]MCX5604909.1 hypothetical protein [Streptomyces phaeochromogenes]